MPWLGTWATPDADFLFATSAIGGGSGRRGAKRGAAYITPHPQATCSCTTSSACVPSRVRRYRAHTHRSGPSGGNIPVFFLEQPEPGIHVAVGHLEQPRSAACGLVHDPVALGQREDVALAPPDRLVADLALARAFHHAAHR